MAESDFACLPDNSPFKRVLLKKCLKRIEKFNQLGVEQVRSQLRPSLATLIYLYFSLYFSITKYLPLPSINNTHHPLVFASRGRFIRRGVQC